MTIANWVTVGSALLLTLLVLIQTRGASLGAGLGTGGEVNIVRRGSDKSIFNLTILVGLVFCGSLLANII
jgi:protein translocase SecG subunit